MSVDQTRFFSFFAVIIEVQFSCASAVMKTVQVYSTVQYWTGAGNLRTEGGRNRKL